MDAPYELSDLAPEPPEEWRRMLRFAGWGAVERAAAARSVAILFQHGPELVAQTYDYLRQVPETAAILGWRQPGDEAHLEERRRFFTLWLTRTLGLDTSDEFAEVLFRAGKSHAGHGPRGIHTPPAYVIAAFGLVQASFAGYLGLAQFPTDAFAAAMAAWSKYLSVQLNQMLLGYQIARDLHQGMYAIRCNVYGRLRPLIGARHVDVFVDGEARVGDVLRKFFNYYPQIRPEALDRVWQSRDTEDGLWMSVTPSYIPRYGWRLLLNGRELRYNSGGLVTPVQTADQIAIFPPGR